MQARLQESEYIHRLVVNNSPDLIFMLDQKQKFTFVNDRAERLLGVAPASLLGQPFSVLLAPNKHHLAQDFLTGVVHHQPLLQRIELPLLSKSFNRGREKIHMEISAIAAPTEGGATRTPNPAPHRIFGSARDLTDRRDAERRLRETSAQLQDLLHASPAIIYSRPADGFDPSFVSSNFHERFGHHPNELVGIPGRFLQLVHPDDRGALLSMAQVLRVGGEATTEYRIRHGKEGWRWIRDTAKLRFDEAGEAVEVVGSWFDNTEMHLLADQLTHQASHDALTGLANRRAFEHRLQSMIDSARGKAHQHALCYLDLDQFKVVNDTCGHAAGDALLHELAHILKSKIRKNDLLARLGGDEFGILVEHCDVAEARQIADSLCRAVNDFRFAWSNRVFHISASIGVVPITAESEGIAGVMSFADSACYAAKDSGRNRVKVFAHDSVELSRRQGEMEWVACMNRAFEEDRFCLAYQPIIPVDQQGGPQRHHYELLVRLRHQDGHLVMPGAFLPAAERYHLAGRLDHWVVKHAFNWLRGHPEHLRDLYLCSINLSGHSMGDEKLLKMIEREVAADASLAQRICFEVTETAAIANLKHAIQFIETLKGLGIQFALDDFGSGLSSFAYLKTLPVDFLKIDGVFIENLASNPVDQAMVRSINDIGQVMGMKTIAEYVDNKETLSILKEIGVDFAQGYWIGEPESLQQLHSGYCLPAAL
jgi:diguanylate cyclase (GGDEF)-like protein/PAS domain S-box-containing protein